MPNKVGEIYVEIEARLNRLEAQLRGAEDKVKKSASKMDSEFGKVGESIKAWQVKAAAAVGVVSFLNGIAAGVARSIDKWSVAIAEYNRGMKTASDLMEDLRSGAEGLPVVGGFVSLGRSIREMVTGARAELMDLERDQQRAQENLSRQQKRLGKITDAKEATKEAERQLRLLKAANEEERIRIALRFKLEDIQENARKRKMGGGSSRVFDEANEAERNAAIAAADKRVREIRNREAEERAERRKSVVDAVKDRARALADGFREELAAMKDRSRRIKAVESELAAARLEQQGKAEEAMVVRIRQSFAQRRDMAKSQAERLALDQLEAFQVASARRVAAPEPQTGVDDFSTTLGSFRVVQGANQAPTGSEQKKQSDMMRNIEAGMVRMVHKFVDGADSPQIVLFR